MIIISFLLWIGQLSFGLYNFFEKKVIRCDLSFLFRCINCFPNAKLNIFISISKDLSGSVITNIGLLMILYLIWSKISCYFYIYLKVLLFFMSSIRGIVNRPNPSTKCRQKLMNPRNPRISLTFVSYGQYFTVSIFLSFISIVLGLILNPRQSIS